MARFYTTSFIMQFQRVFGVELFISRYLKKNLRVVDAEQDNESYNRPIGSMTLLIFHLMEIVQLLSLRTEIQWPSEFS